jgi:large subunit ribosomal protein L30
MATKTAKSQSAGNIKITLNKGLVGKMESQRKVVRALGLGKFGSSVVHADSPTIRGMVRKISHLITVESTNEAPKANPHGHHAHQKAEQK